MKIGILSQYPELYSTRRLVEACESRGHEALVINPLNCYMNINSVQPTIHLEGEDIGQFDAIIPRIHASITFYGCALVRQFEMMGVYAINNSISISRSRDKLRALQLLSRQNVGMPITGFASKPDDIPDLISMVGGAPLVNQTAGRDSGDRGGIGGNQKGGRERDRSFSGAESQYYGAGVHQGVQWQRHSLFCGG